jgi:hypothetical protein
MTEGVSEVVVVGSEGGKGNEGYQALAALNEGFLGTGHSTSVEISFIAMALIAGYVAVSTARYFLHGSRLLAAVAGALGFEKDLR